MSTLRTPVDNFRVLCRLLLNQIKTKTTRTTASVAATPTKNKTIEFCDTIEFVVGINVLATIEFVITLEFVSTTEFVIGI